MKRIKEEEIKRILKKHNKKKLKIQINGVFQQETVMEKIEILFLNKDTEIHIKDEKNYFVLSLAYIEGIYFLQKNKLKFLTENDIEILIIFL